MIIKFFKKLVNKLRTTLVLKKTKNRFKKINKISSVESDGYIVRGAKSNDLKEIAPVYEQLNGMKLSRSNIYLLSSCEENLIFVALLNEAGQEPKVIGMNMYYINPRDFKEGTIHEGFVGVLPEYEGKGIATSMRKQAVTYFNKAGFKGISSRVSTSNLGSLRSAEKLGFKPVETYFDEIMQEERHYLINWF